VTIGTHKRAAAHFSTAPEIEEMRIKIRRKNKAITS
jgi:hypothetical protein